MIADAAIAFSASPLSFRRLHAIPPVRGGSRVKFACKCRRTALPGYATHGFTTSNAGNHCTEAHDLAWALRGGR